MYKIIDMKNRFGRPYGYIWVYDNGRQEARDVYGRLLGSYEPSNDMTKSPSGSVIAYGNVIASLFTDRLEK